MAVPSRLGSALVGGISGERRAVGSSVPPGRSTRGADGAGAPGLVQPEVVPSRLGSALVGSTSGERRPVGSSVPPGRPDPRLPARPAGFRRAVRSRRRAGFTLLEIVAAFVIFFLIVSFAYVQTMNSVDQSIDAARARQLRMLAERKLTELALFERYHDDNLGPEPFDNLPDELREEYEGWEWQIEVRDVTVFGTQKDENAPYLFQENDPGTQEETASSSSSSSTKKKGETQMLREIVLKVTAPADDGGEGDSIEIVTFLPQVPAKAATPAAPGGSGN